MTSGRAIPELEDEQTEFKRAAALRDLETISRAVVSMLNGRGGSVWIGAVEQDERRVGLERIDEVEREKRRVEDHLTAAIEPPPRDEVRVEPFEIGTGEQILVVRVQRGRRGPYAQLRGGGRHFALRVGARSRPMTHAELAEAFREQKGETDGLRSSSEDAWKSETERVLANRERELWARIACHPPPDLAISSPETKQRLDELLHDAPRSGNRTIGWTFTSSSVRFVPMAGSDELIAGGPNEATWIEVRQDGAFTFRAPIERLTHASAQELYPYALLELPTSACRIVAAFLQTMDAPSAGRIMADFGLIGVQGMRVRPGTPGSIAYELHPCIISADTIRPEPIEERIGSFIEAPDALAWKALTALYFRLGFFEDRMPTDVYDQRHRRLNFPR